MSAAEEGRDHGGQMVKESRFVNVWKIIAFSLLALLLAWAPFVAHTADSVATFDDNEEYEVIAALLFPNEPEIPDEIKGDKLRADLYLALQRSNADLSGLGLGSGFFIIIDATSTEKVSNPPAKEGNTTMIEDFNAKNSKRWKLDRQKLTSLVPKNVRITFVSPEQLSAVFSGNDGGWDESRRRFGREGHTSVSRVGFSPDRTKAVIGIHHQADYEMGVGYRVYLKKAQKSGKWLIDGSVLTRRS